MLTHLQQLQAANKAQHHYTPLASIDIPTAITPIDYDAIKELAREHTYAVLDGGTISLQAKNWYTLLYQAKLKSTVPSFATAVTTPQALRQLYLHIPTSKFARSPYNSPTACKRIDRYLRAIHNVPTDWYVSMATPCDASYYQGHAEQCITEHGNPNAIIKAEFRPYDCVSRHVGTMHNCIVEHEHAKPPEAFRNSLSTAKYLRTGNVNDALCLPAPTNVRANWRQTEQDVIDFEGKDNYENKAATYDTHVLREAVITGKCKHAYVIEGVKKAAHMMAETGDYAVAVSGCWQYDAPSQASLLGWAIKKTKEATPEQTARQPLPTIAWLIDHGVDITFITDVDYVTNPSVYDGVNTGVATYLAYNQGRVNIRLQRTKAQCELDGVKQLIDRCSPGNYFAVTTDDNRKYGYRTTRLIEHTKGRLKGQVTEVPHFKWAASGIDDLTYDSIQSALQTIQLDDTMQAKLDNASIDQLILDQDNQANGAKAMTRATQPTAKKNATRTGGTRTTVKGVALDYLAGVNPKKVVVTTGESGACLYLYCNTEGRYQQVTADNEVVYYELLDELQDLLINDKHIDCVSSFLNQLIDELPAVAMLTARSQGFKRLSNVKLQQERQLVSLKGGDTINEQGYLQPASPDVFTLTQLNVSLEECKEAYNRMQAIDWQPIEALSKRLDVGATATALKLSRFEVVKRMLALEIGLPATGGSYNGLEAIVFQSGCSGGGKTVADNAINSLVGLGYVAPNMDLTTLSKNRFAKYNLKGKLVATASDVLTINEEQETTLRNCYGVTLVEQKNRPAEQALLTPVFRFSSNYDKPYTADVAGSMTRRTLLKKYIAPMVDSEWEGYSSPDLMMRDVYAGLLYEQLVINRVSRHQLEQLFKQLVAACNYKQPRTINNTTQLTIERACLYTGNDSDGLSMAQLYSVASNLAPLYGFDRSKNVANMADALRAMQLTNSSTIAQSRGANPIKLSWCDKLKDYVLHGYTFDKEWLTAFAVEAQKGASGKKLEYAFNLGMYLRKYEPLTISDVQRAAICDYKSELMEEASHAVDLSVKG